MAEPERRQAARVHLLVEVKALALGESRLCRSQNVSESGCVLLCPNPFPAGTDVVLRFDVPIPNTSTVRFEGKGSVVRAVVGESMGIRFTALQEGHRKTLAALVEHSEQPKL